MVRKCIENVYGPYKDRIGRDGHRRWIVKFIGPDGPASESFAGEGAEAEARKFVADARAKLEGLKVSEAVAEFIADMVERGVREKSRASTEHRLRTFFHLSAGTNGGLLADVTRSRAKTLLEATKVRTRAVWIRGGHMGKKKLGKRAVQRPRSVTYRAGMLAEATTFARWCADRGYLPTDRHNKTALDGLEVKGKRRRGKLQLRVDELSRWERVALAAADQGDVRAFVAVLTFYLGTRAGEPLGLRARDIDRGGREAVVEDSKTEAGKRRVEIPEHLRARLLEFRRGRGPGDLLFPGITVDQMLTTVRALCRRAGVTLVTTQSLRGLHATLAEEIGATGPAIARQLGHADVGQTAVAPYTAPGTRQRSQQRRVLQVLTGGRSA